MSPQISIIVPLYNAKKHVADLCKLCTNQTRLLWEMILIDDGSKDGTPALCKKYAEKDERIRLICNQHQGVSVARNTGIEAARGEWITFVDADDLLLDGFLASLYEATCQNKDVDIAYCGYAVVTGASTTLNTYKTKTYIGDEQIKDLLGSSDILYRCSPWAKLFRRSVMMDHHLRFDTNLSISEDRLFFYQYLLHAKGIATTSYIGYIYGSFSPTSLKNKHFPIEMLSYRQEKMTEETHRILNRFSLEGDDAYLLIEHLMKIMQASMQSAFAETGLSSKTCQTQKDFFAKHFDKVLYDKLAQSKKWQSQLANNFLMKDILGNSFWRINWKLFCNDLNLHIRMFAHRLLPKKDITNSYECALKIINK